MPLEQAVNPQWMKIAGLALHGLVALLMLWSGFGKVFGFAPAEVVEHMTRQGLKERIPLIGMGEMAGAILLILPWTSPLGALVVSAFWGGAICLHMAFAEAYTMEAGVLLVTWLGAFLRGSIPWMG
jgi:uncharacterized membrane protein YphA (DoxX/SURF4 family)